MLLACRTVRFFLLRGSESEILSFIMIPQVDLHCHLLPDWDDGPSDFAESLAMAKRSSEAGCKTIVVTPHIDRAFLREARPACEVALAVEELEEKLRAHGVDIRLVAGGELHLATPDLPRRIANEPCLSIGGKNVYSLIESPVNSWPSHAPQILYHLSLSGITPLIAHPERYAEVQKDIGIMAQLVDKGARLQITARSLVGKDRKAKNCSEKMLRAGLVSVVASDAHNSEAVLIHEVIERVVELVGEVAAQRILVDNPLAIVEGRPVRRMSPVEMPRGFGAKTSFFGLSRWRRADENQSRRTNC